MTVILKYPYSREIDEQHKYTELHHHAATKMVNLSDSDSDSEDTENSGHSWDACDTLQRFQYITPVSIIYIHMQVYNKLISQRLIPHIRDECISSHIIS